MDDRVLLEAIGKMMDEKLAINNEQLRQEIMLDFNTVIEDKVSKEIRLIAEQHSDIVARLPYVEEQAEIKSRVRVLERVVSNLGAEIDKLKKAE